MKKAKLVIAILVSIVMLLSLAACGGSKGGQVGGSQTGGTSTTSGKQSASKTEDGKTLVTLWHFGDATEVADAIMKGNPDLFIEHLTIGYSDFVNKVQTAVAGGSPIGDIMLCEMGWRYRIFEMDVLDHLEQEPYNVNRSNIMEHQIPLTSYKGKIMGLESSINVSGLAYKAPLTEKYFGTSDPDELEEMFPTWESMFEAGKKVFDESGGTCYMFSSWSVVQEFFNNYGIEPYIKDNKPTDYLLNECAETRYNLLKLAMDYDAFDPTIPTNAAPGLNASYPEDNHIFYNIATWGVRGKLKTYDPDSVGRWRIMQTPLGPTNQGGTLYCISKDSKVKEAAWKAVSWLCASIDGGNAYYEVSEYFIPHKPFIEQFDFDKCVDPYFGVQNIAKKYVDMSKVMTLREVAPYLNQCYEAYQAAEVAVMTDPSVTLEQYKELVRKEVYERCPDLDWD